MQNRQEWLESTKKKQFIVDLDEDLYYQLKTKALVNKTTMAKIVRGLIVLYTNNKNI